MARMAGSGLKDSSYAIDGAVRSYAQRHLFVWECSLECDYIVACVEQRRI